MADVITHKAYRKDTPASVAHPTSRVKRQHVEEYRISRFQLPADDVESARDGAKK
jgi:hypothetical protein